MRHWNPKHKQAEHCDTFERQSSAQDSREENRSPVTSDSDQSKISRTVLPSFSVTLKSTSSFSALILRLPFSLTPPGPRSLAFSASRRAILARRSPPSASESESDKVSSTVLRLHCFFCAAGSAGPGERLAAGEGDSRASAPAGSAAASAEAVHTRTSQQAGVYTADGKGTYARQSSRARA